MRLINVETLKLEEFLDYRAPPYAILSHTWGDDYEELSFRDVEDGNINKPGIGSAKFRGCCRQAAEDGLLYAWIDTCCIDKTNLVELSEAINSMFRWYQRASICYAFLSDVPSCDNFRQKGSKFQSSRWFQRGWTLQELLAPKTMRFYGAVSPSDAHNRQAAIDTNLVQGWRLLGNKRSMSTTIASITGIPRHYLLGIAALHTASVAQRMSWAAHRDTKRKEDLAYCLLGIFNITMPMIYGEGGEQAFFRLQEQIMKVTRDDSILAWGLGTNDSSANNITGDATAGRVVAKAPADFANTRHIIHRDQTLKYMNSVDISGGSIRAYLPLHTTHTGQIVGLLSCGPEKNSQQVVGIPLIKLSMGSFDEYARPRGYDSSLYPTMVATTEPKPIRIKHDSQENGPMDLGGLFFHYEDDDFTDLNLKVIDVAPRSYWDEERALIMCAPIADDGVVGQVLIRLRHDTQELKDFVIVLEYKKECSDALVECLIFICSRSLLLEELVVYLPSMMQKLDGKREAKNELLSLSITLERVERQPIFVVRPEPVLDGVFTTVDATVELEKKNLIRESLQLLEENEEIDGEDEELEDQKNYYENSLKEPIYPMGKYTKRWDIPGQDEKLRFPLPGTTVLEWAAAKGLIEVVKQRLENGADINASDQNGCTPLIAAFTAGQFEVAKLLIEHGAKIGDRIPEGATPLFVAAASGCVELVQLLLNEGADVEGGGNPNGTPLLAAASGGHADVVRLLLDHGAQIEIRDEADLTALLIASERGHTDVIRLLLNRGAKTDAESDEDIPQLMLDSGEGHTDIVWLVLDDGTDMEDKRKGGGAELMAASDEGKKDISKGTQANPHDEDGRTMLIRASGGGRTETARQLLAIGITDLHAQDKEGWTTLEWATKNRHEAIVQLLGDAENDDSEKVDADGLEN